MIAEGDLVTITGLWIDSYATNQTSFINGQNKAFEMQTIFEVQWVYVQNKRTIVSLKGFEWSVVADQLSPVFKR